MTGVKSRVAFDFSFEHPRRTSGWERYGRGLFEALRPEAESTGLTVEAIAPKKTRSSRLGRLVSDARWHFTGAPRAFNRGCYDLFYSLTMPPPKHLSGPTVWTVHDDLILGGHANFARRGAKIWSPRAMRASAWATRIVVSAQCIKDDLSLAGVLPEKIAVIRPGVDALPSPKPPRSFVHSDGSYLSTIGPEFLLALGTVEERKNPSFAAAIGNELDLPVLFAGRSTKRMRTKVSSIWNGSMFTVNLDDEGVSWCLSRASALLSVSRYEGFDFPAHEAGQFGLPVIASDIPVHREYSIPGWYLYQEGNLAEACRQTSRAIEIGRMAAKVPSGWDEAAQSYIRLFHLLLH